MPITVTKVSNLTNAKNTRKVNITQEEYDNYFNLPRKERPLIQNAFPKLSKDDREFLLSGITPEEWDAEFGPDE